MQMQPEREPAMPKVLLVSEFLDDGKGYNAYRFVLGDPTSEACLLTLLERTVCTYMGNSSLLFALKGPAAEAEALRHAMRPGGRLSVEHLFTEQGAKDSMILKHPNGTGTVLVMRSQSISKDNAPSDDRLREAILLATQGVPLSHHHVEHLLARLDALNEVARVCAEPEWSSESMDAVNEVVSPIIDVSQFEDDEDRSNQP